MCVLFVHLANTIIVEMCHWMRRGAVCVCTICTSGKHYHCRNVSLDEAGCSVCVLFVHLANAIIIEI